MGRVNVRRVLVTERLAREIRNAVTASLHDSEYYMTAEEWDAAADAAVEAVRDHVPHDTGRHLDAVCYRPCKAPATWRVRSTPTEEDPAGGTWLGSCGRHLSTIAAEITCGLNVELDLDRIRGSEK